MLPALILCGLGLAAVAAALFTGRRGASAFAFAGFLTCLLGLGLALSLMGLVVNESPEAIEQQVPTYISHTFSIDPLTMFFGALALGICGLSMLLSAEFLEKVMEEHQCEFLALIAFSCFGMVCVAAARELITLFFSLELVSITGYLLAGMLRRQERSVEAALKYFLLGAVSTAIMLFGMSLIFGMTGTTDLAKIRSSLAGIGMDPLVITGVLAVVVGLGFKIAMVPFHMWCPEVYEGAPTPATAFLSVGPKVAGFVAVIRVMLYGFGADFEAAPWVETVMGLCAISMTLGNVVACRQTNIKRMLAYSSIAHTGYILIGAVCLASTDLAVPAILAYAVVYVIMNIGAFGVVIAFSNTERRDDLEAYNGLYRRSPFLAVSWVIFAMSLAGLPPTAGFLGKFYVFAAAVDAKVYWLAVVGIVNAVISVWYYFRVAHHMFFLKAAVERPILVGRGVGLAIALSLAGTLVLVPAFPMLYSLIEDATRFIAGW